MLLLDTDTHCDLTLFENVWCHFLVVFCKFLEGVFFEFDVSRFFLEGAVLPRFVEESLRRSSCRELLN